MPRRKAPKKAMKVRRSSIPVVIDQSVSEQERKQKLDAFIADFEIERQARLRAIRDDGDNLIRKVISLYQAELLKMPQSIREMKFVDFKDKYQCDVNLALMQSTREELDRINKTTTIHKQRRTKKTTTTTMFETIDEDAPPTVRRAPVADYTGRVTRTAARVKGAPVWADTPLVTPAFNPRLCRTNKPRQTAAERCTFVFDAENSPKIEIPVNGKNMILSENSELDEESRVVLENIRKMISSMLHNE